LGFQPSALIKRVHRLKQIQKRLQLLGGEPAEQLKALRLLAAELEACVLLTCQSLPSVELRPGGVPLLHDLPALEAMQTYPHVIGMLHREEFWNTTTSKRGQAELMLVKNSDNPLGTLLFGFEPMASCFIEIDAPSRATDPQTERHQWQRPPR
jgi:replicative DNA helicase